ncbi:hypothetical protein K439DRAFT_1526606 [Ramaria rubella]|nr:hypothetical protein K439DRAFT_1526606 [Ramaria rubella]
MPSIEDAMTPTYVVADFGSGKFNCSTLSQSFTDHKSDQIAPYALRPPEILIGGPWSEEVDIWTFGCLVFELITGCALFKYEAHPKFNLDELNYFLYTMICYTGEDFEANQLSISRQVL